LCTCKVSFLNLVSFFSHVYILGNGYNVSVEDIQKIKIGFCDLKLVFTNSTTIALYVVNQIVIRMGALNCFELFLKVNFHFNSSDMDNMKRQINIYFS
jgi:hypothetical protein